MKDINREQEIRDLCVEYRSTGISHIFHPFFERLLEIANNMVSELAFYKKGAETWKFLYDNLEEDFLRRTAWIPCNTRLPEKEGNYEVTCKYAEKLNITGFAHFKDGEFPRGMNVIAWKLASQPYIEPTILMKG